MIILLFIGHALEKFYMDFFPVNEKNKDVGKKFSNAYPVNKNIIIWYNIAVFDGGSRDFDFERQEKYHHGRLSNWKFHRFPADTYDSSRLITSYQFIIININKLATKKATFGK